MSRPYDECDEPIQAPGPKPPPGLKPRWLVDMLRIEEILRAMFAYNANRMPIPEEWVDELNDLVWRQRESVIQEQAYSIA